MTDLELKIQILKYLGHQLKKSLDLQFDHPHPIPASGSRHLYRHSMQLAPVSIERDNTKSQNSKTMLSATSPSDSFYLTDIFNTLYESNKHSEFVRINKDLKEVHISLLKKFWFNSCVTFQVFYNMLLAPIKNKDWINGTDFLRSIEATHQKNVFRPFVPEKSDQKFNEGIRIQQFLCILYLVYFCLVDFEYGEMSIDGIVCVLRLTRRMGKNSENDLVKLANNFLIIANKMRKEKKTHITFMEFLGVLLNKL